jgi:hypothetical protein
MMKDPYILLHNRAQRIMEYHLQDNCKATPTELAENAAIHLDHDEWLDDSDHWIWELAIEVSENYNQLN